jgi:Cu/Ag efflux protein CusF
MWRVRRPLAAMASAIALCSVAAAQETATEGIFHGRGVVKAVDPGNGAVTLVHDDIEGLKPAMEVAYRVQTRTDSARVCDPAILSISPSTRPIPPSTRSKGVIVDLNLLYYYQ